MPDRETIILVDRDHASRQVLSRILDETAYVIPIDTLDDLQGRWPDEASIFAPDEQLQDTSAALKSVARYYPLIGYGGVSSSSGLTKMLQNYCAGYLVWPDDADHVRGELRELRLSLAHSARSGSSRHAARFHLQNLTNRELEVAVLVAEGLSNKAIASELDISPRTVEVHRSNALGKVKATNTAGLIRAVILAELDGAYDAVNVPDLQDRRLLAA